MGGVMAPAQLHLSFNIAPTHQAFVIANDRPHSLQPMLWGLVPHWSNDGTASGKLINARAEGIEEKPSFREPIRRRRCVVPADSFYEWRTEPGRRKVPYRILSKSGRLLMMAGIWDEWGHGASRLRSFSIITTGANREVSGLHDRMPLLLDEAACRHWLEPLMLEEVLEMLVAPQADDQLQMYRVSEKLNYAGYEGADLHDPVQEDPTLF